MIPDRKAKILHGSWTKTQNITQKQYSNKFSKDFMAHVKKVLKKEKKVALDVMPGTTINNILRTNSDSSQGKGLLKTNV